jgi:glyoxylase-like metal-dependent hydrolase (beta-lactamase superfamily II)
LTVTLLDGGHLWLDGGAMFGIIPKPLWAKATEVDEQNRIPLAMTCLLVESAGKRILVETGAGPKQKYGEKEQGFFRFADHWLLDSFQAAGLDRESIDFVIPTHLHFDHAGGGTMPDDRGGYTPTFPRARYIVQRGEWEDALAGYAVMSTTYRKENLAPLEEAGVLSLLNGEAEIVPGVRVLPLPGHTRYQQGIIIEGGDARVAQPGDMMPTSAHAGIRYNMAYDLLPYENMRNKERLLNEALRGGWRLLLGQDPREAVWQVQSDGRGGISLTGVQQGITK